jgi:hypothetical protein
MDNIEKLIGLSKLEVEEKINKFFNIRYLKGEEIITLDYWPQRINIILDNNDIVKEAWNG